MTSGIRIWTYDTRRDAIMTEDLPVLGSEPPLVGRSYPLLRRLQDRQPVCKVRTHAGDEAWIVTRYAEVKQLLLDERLGRSHPDPPNMPRYYDSALLDMLVTNTDPDVARREHAETRSALTPLFSSRRMAARKPRIAERVRHAVDAILAQGPPADMHSQFSMPLSFGVLCDMLGVPESDEFWAPLSRVLDVVDPHEVRDGVLATVEALAAVAARRRACPGDDVISALCAAQPDDRVVADLAVHLTFSYQATPNSMSASIALLAAYPDQRDLLIKNPALLPNAVEEALRMGKAGGSFMPRYASEDIEIGGVTIKTGDLVLCDHFSANLDGRVFDEPERFDVTRSPNPHVAFSHGKWHCTGAPLARIEIQETFSALVSRMPTMQLAVPLEELRVNSVEQLTAGMVSVPVTW
jgi:cytochrome P450 monooxygenase